MELPRQREAAAAEGDDPPGWSRDPPGAAEGTSAAWNGTCGRTPERNDPRDLPAPAGPGCSCPTRGVPAAPTSSRGLACPTRGPEEDGVGGGRGARRPRRRNRPVPGEQEGSGKRPREAPRSSGGDEGPVPGGAPRGLLGGGSRGWARRAARGARAGAGLVLRQLRAVGSLLLLLLLLLLRLGRRLGKRLRDTGAFRSLVLTPGGRRRDPPGAGEELGRLLRLAELPEEELDPFAVLGVAASAPDAELRRAYRRLAVLVHPDKNQHPRAEAAFKVLGAAWEMVGTPERRRQHELRRVARGELARSVGEFLARLQEELREALGTMGCSKCRGRHRRFELDRDPRQARFCAACGGRHAAEEGDLWAESSLWGLRVTYLALLGGRVYDITEWAGCQRVGIAPDTHRAPYHISLGPRGAGRPRTTAKGSPPGPPPDLQDFLTRVFQGGLGGDGDPFPAPPGAAPRPEGAAPRGEAKPRRRRRVRR